ncbi:hypothetical protein ACIXJZ_06130 [Bacteroides fragilis]|uniref:Uncharacterized protein n=1 Tax=Bacteroides fragilis TaxID=817 RepID=A0A5M5RVW0_BACFG|nr:hypothetical protein F2841_11120 [Bacteroides fragilis]KAA4780249.1 hypothetical protein F3B22_10405 [Bacteroides fragilis]KAA4789205.1 hypothetical protein F3B20_05885 [Bacteroides fragilis]KAA4793761.1 hypothetical protein F3B21_04105 [Bacteroides fragilis]KAA4794999.1 hypothetical protein F2047_03400 [Bacteroides fragilis]
MLVIIWDDGGSNSSSHCVVKRELMEFADKLKMNFWVIYYPPYCS